MWRQAEKAGTFGGIIRVALLTAQRREKVASMRWADLKGAAWTIPRTDREKGAGGTLILPPAALAVIQSQPVISKSPYVFTGRRENAFNGFSKSKAAFNEALPKIPAADGTLQPCPTGPFTI